MLEHVLITADNSRWAVICVSAFTCGALFLGLLRWREEKRFASEVTSLAHHIVVVILSSWAIYNNFDSIRGNSALSVSSHFPIVNTIQWINIGYFLYDSVNAVVWEHNFILHHFVALYGFGVSDYYGRGGLGNAVNTLIAEVGSIAYNIYNKNKSTGNYIRFVCVYAASRLVFMYWTWMVFEQLGSEAIGGDDVSVLRNSIYVFQTLLVLVNIHFLSVHLRKVSRILSKGN